MLDYNKLRKLIEIQNIGFDEVERLAEYLGVDFFSLFDKKNRRLNSPR